MPSATSARAAFIRASALFIVEIFYSAGRAEERGKITGTKARVAIDRRRMMGVTWIEDIDQTLAAAKEQSRPILLDFSAAPA